MTADAHGPWPDPPPPRPLDWTQVAPETWTATGPTGTGWRIERADDGRVAITLGTWSRPDWWADSPEAAMALVERFEARHDDPMPAVMGRSWREVEADHEGLRTEAEAGVVEWAWGPFNAAWERLEPFWNEQHGERPRARRLGRAPERRSDARLYGFDESGRVLVSRDFRYDDVVRRETLLVGEVVLVFEAEGMRGTPRVRLSQLHVPARDAAGQLARLDIWFSDPVAEGFGWRGTAYGYEGDRLVRIWSSSRGAPGIGWTHRRIGGDRLANIEVARRPELCLTYDDAGRLATITEADGQIVYRRSAPGAARKASRLVLDELPERIARWAGRAAPEGEVYCLAIAYGEPYNRPLPPALGLGTTEELEAWRRSLRPSDLPLVMWNPAEFARFDPEPAELLGDERLEEAYRVLNQEWASTDDDRQPRRLLVEVAKRLAAREWPALRPSPQGFCVYAVDLELEDLERNLRASAPKDVRSRLTGS